MTIWCRIKQSQVKALSNQLKKNFFQTNAFCLINHRSEITRFSAVENQSWVFSKNPFQFGNNARFFAAPVQVIPKHERKDKEDGPRLNEDIKASYIRLVTEEEREYIKEFFYQQDSKYNINCARCKKAIDFGITSEDDEVTEWWEENMREMEGHSVISRYEALKRAKELKLDLVEVDRQSKPPVCKIVDYHKEKFQKELKDKERAKSKKSESLRTGSHKEVRISSKIEKKDLQMKADAIRRTTERGYRVKCMAVGKEDEDLGTLLGRLAALIEDFCIVESGPKVERKQAYIIVRHIKYGPSKKGKGKEKIVVPPSNFNSSQSEDYTVEEEKGTLSDSVEELPALKKNKSTWSVFDKNDDCDEVFEIGNNASKVMAPKVQPAMENRYKRGPANGGPPPRQMNEDLRNSTRFEQPRFQNQGGQRHFDPTTPPPPSPSIGMFSAQQVNNEPQRQGEPAEMNRYSPQRQHEPAEANRYSSQRQNGPSEVNRYSSQRQNGPVEGNRYSSQRQNGPAEGNRYNRGPNPNPQGPNANPRGSTDCQYDARR